MLGQEAGSPDSDNDSANVANSVNSTNVTSAVMCHPDFINMCGLCIPSCERIHHNSQLAISYAVDDVFWVIAEVSTTVGALAFLVFSLIRRKDV